MNFKPKFGNFLFAFIKNGCQLEHFHQELSIRIWKQIQNSITSFRDIESFECEVSLIQKANNKKNNVTGSVQWWFIGTHFITRDYYMIRSTRTPTKNCAKFQVVKCSFDERVMSVPRDSILIFLPQAHVGCEMCEATLKAKLARAGRNFIVENNSR